MKTSPILTVFCNRLTVAVAMFMAFVSIFFMSPTPNYPVYAQSNDKPKNEDGENAPDIPYEPTYPTAPGLKQGLWGSSSPAANYYGGLHASGIGFQYWNNYLMMMSISERLRNVPMVTYTGDGADGVGAAPTVGGGYNEGSSYSTGGFDTAPYGPGYAPAYEGAPGYQSGYPVYQDGTLINPQTSNVVDSALYRGQAEYGDPGTLIYSLWGGVVGGSGKIKEHAEHPGYDTKQYGGFVGLDLFGSCDCRSGFFYGYQQSEMKQEGLYYDYGVSQSGNLFDPTELTGMGNELQYQTTYDYLTQYNGQYHGKLKSDNHLIGLYHQFGSEFIYNIATLRIGYNRVKSDQTISESGTTSGSITEMVTAFTDGKQYGEPIFNPNPQAIPASPGSATRTLSGKYNEYLGGASFERGANLKFMNLLTFTPRGALDYNFLYRNKFDETISSGGSLHYKSKSYHSLRSNLGANLALDLYPGNQHFKIVGRGSWVHEFLNAMSGKTSLTDFAGVEQVLYGNSTGRDWAIVGAGAEWTIVPAFMIFGNYDFIKNKYVSSHYGDVGLKLMW